MRLHQENKDLNKTVWKLQEQKADQEVSNAHLAKLSRMSEAKTAWLKANHA